MPLWIAGSFVLAVAFAFQAFPYIKRYAREWNSWGASQLKTAVCNGGQAGAAIRAVLRKGAPVELLPYSDPSDAGGQTQVFEPGDRVIDVLCRYDECCYGRLEMVTSEIRATRKFVALDGVPATEDEQKAILAAVEKEIPPERSGLVCFSYDKVLGQKDFLLMGTVNKTFVHWDGVAKDGAIFVFLAGALLCAGGAYRRRRREQYLKLGRECLNCGYELGGLNRTDRFTCPECGTTATK